VQATGSDRELALAAAQEVASLLARIEHPLRLSQVAVPDNDFEACAALALNDGATSTNPRAVRSAAEIVAVYREAL
jgi:alcohol dehydrogenase class IV